SGGVRAISAGMYHTCAVTSAGAVNCWGYNSYGQIGVDSTSPAFLTPQPVHGLANGVQEISIGGVHGCAVNWQYRLFCWGGNDHGQIGDGTTTNRLAPVEVAAGVRAVGAGGAHTCIVKTD